ncbi:MAG: serine/threonine protein kinase [Deltaproteobacteria bacterium]|nr:serine/threonine protein kinase [Deltaproteobacteria bacterium]
MDSADVRQDLLFCRGCGKHYRGRRRRCPDDGAELEWVRPFAGEEGTRVDDRYVLERRIGIGGMGTVWRARDELTGRKVALKLLNERYAAHAASAQRFLREARLMRKVNHPGVVSLHRFGPTGDGALLIDMEYIDGETVRERVLRVGGGVDMEIGLRVLDGLLAALAACHDAGLVHLDVKPENVMLHTAVHEGTVKLVDFGIAQPIGPIEHGEDFVVLGTPAFMSPEQVRGVPVDARTDLYLVGCVAFELLTGEPPFRGDKPFELCQAQVLTAPPTLAERMPGKKLPDGLDRWVAALLEKNPDNRPRSARVAREALRQIRLRHREASLPRAHSPRPASISRLMHADPARIQIANSQGAVRALRALVEVRQIGDGGTLYGPKALEEMAKHLLAGAVAELRDCGATVLGPEGAFLDIRMACDDDERGAIHHLLDMLGKMHADVGRIPEPRLEVRAAVLADSPDAPGFLQSRPQHELAALLHIGPDTHVRVDEHVARWAGRRPIVRLASFREAGISGLTTLYATTLQQAV